MIDRHAGIESDRIRPVSRAAAGAVADAYLTTELVTASPDRLQARLYDAAIRICRQAEEALGNGHVDRAGDQLRRARKIVRHLRGALPTGRTGQWADRFATLYEQVHRRLIEADYYRRRESIHESIELLDHQRPAWSALVSELGRGRRRGTDRAAAASSWIG